MKKLALFLSVAILALSSCKKEEVEPTPVNNNNNGGGNQTTTWPTGIVDNTTSGGHYLVVEGSPMTTINDNCVSPIEHTFTSGTAYNLTVTTDFQGTNVLFSGTVTFDLYGQCTISNLSPSNTLTLQYGDFCTTSNLNRLFFN